MCRCWWNTETGYLEACPKHEAEVMDKMMEKEEQVNVAPPIHVMYWYAETREVALKIADSMSDEHSLVGPEDIIALALRDAYLAGYEDGKKK